MAARPELLLLDEPVTGMNPEESRLMMSYIKNIQSMGITVLLVEHSMKVVMNVCERICVLSYGQQMAVGAPDVICRDQRVIEAYLGKEYASRDQWTSPWPTARSKSCMALSLVVEPKQHCRFDRRQRSR